MDEATRLRRLDALVAEHVMDELVYRWVDPTDGQMWYAVSPSRAGSIVVTDDDHHIIHRFPRPSRDLLYRSTDIAAAWGIVDKLGTGSDGLHFLLEIVVPDLGCYAGFGSGNLNISPTVPEAICLAALTLKGISFAPGSVVPLETPAA